MKGRQTFQQKKKKQYTKSIGTIFPYKWNKATKITNNLKKIVMEDLCTACLCSGRILFKIEGTEIQELYVQILSEISVSELYYYK